MSELKPCLTCFSVDCSCTNEELEYGMLERSNKKLQESHAILTKQVETLRGALDDVASDAQDLCDHEIDGGAPENRWDELRSALIRTSKLVEIPR